MNPYQQVLQELIKNLSIFHSMGLEPISLQLNVGTPKQRQNAINKMIKYVAHLGEFIRNYKQELTKAHRKAKVAASGQELIALADYLDYNGFHSLADKVDDIIKISAEFYKSAESGQLIQAYRMLNEAHKNIQHDLITHHNDLDMLKKSINETLYGNFYKGLEVLEKSINVFADDKFAASRDLLIILSDNLDKNELYALADKTDEVLGIIKIAEDYGFVPRMRKSDEDFSSQNKPFKPMNEGSLSTRYCPDHRGVQTIRIEENLYQCPLDGKVYNYQSGYTDYEGQRVPGGSVAAQTPQTSNYGGIPMRIYDSRSDVLNRMN